jgi:glycerol uptake facilitator protein
MVADRLEAGTSLDDVAPLGRRLGAEFLGTLLFVAAGAGTAAAIAVAPLGRLQKLTELLQAQGGPPTADPVLKALFTESGIAGSLPIALAFGFALAVLVYAFGGVSGAHFNPAVTFALAVGRRFRWTEVPLYWIVQCAGGVAGAFIIVGIYNRGAGDNPVADALYGATTVAAGVENWNAVLAEAFIAFVLMTAIMAVAVDPRAPKGWSGLVIGLGLTAGILVTGPATGGSANFARSLGPFVASMVKDAGNIPWSDLYIYALGPLIGAAAAALIYESVTGLERIAPAPSPGAATHDEEGFGRPVTTTGLGSATPPGLAPTGEGSPPRTPPGLAPTDDPNQPHT